MTQAGPRRLNKPMAPIRSGTIRRVLVAAVALYAMLVGSFVSGIAPAFAAGADHAAICGHDASGDPAPFPSGHQHDCCLAACAAAASGAVAPLLPDAGFLARPERSASALTWARLAFSPDAVRITLPLHARGPPSL